MLGDADLEVVVVGVGDLELDVFIDCLAALDVAGDFFVVEVLLDVFAAPVLLVGPEDLAGEQELPEAVVFRLLMTAGLETDFVDKG